MTGQEKVNILLVDDQPGKLLSYEAILSGLNENLLKAGSGREALEHLLKTDVAVVLVDVCMPDLDGFQLAAMIRDHPRFQKTAIIFISAILLSEIDSLRGYEMGAVDYVPVPVVPEVLRAKVKVFAELYRKTKELELLNQQLEERVAARTVELERSTALLQKSEERRSLALSAGRMGSWEWDAESGRYSWDNGQYRIFGVEAETFAVTAENIRPLIHSDDWKVLQDSFEKLAKTRDAIQFEFRVRRLDGRLRWCVASAAASVDENDRIVRVSGVTYDITERKEAEEKQTLLAREVDHRAKNALALVQSILRLTRSDNLAEYASAVEGRIGALSRAHTILSQSRWHGANLRGLIDEELAPYKASGENRVEIAGPNIFLQPAAAQTIALAFHELVTNAAKYGALSIASGRLRLSWNIENGMLKVYWKESGGPVTAPPTYRGFGTRIIVASVEQQLGGRVLLNWHLKGLHCNFIIPLPKTLIMKNRPEASIANDDIGCPTIPLTGTRILVVEDEVLVALALNDVLVELGFSVSGPFASISEARESLNENSIAAAILDVNLGGELIYPLAEILHDCAVPFIFVTGYGAESIDPRFSDAPVLQKPIERDILKRIFVKPATQPAQGIKGKIASIEGA